jgi:hypothetical protein
LSLVVEALVEIVTEPEMTPDDLLRIDSQAPLDDFCAEITLALLTNPEWYAPRGTWPPPLFDGLQSRTTHVEFGRVDRTDRRTAAAKMTHALLYGCVAEPVVRDKLLHAFFDVDVIDPAADPNIRYPGPDGRIEVRFTAPGPRDAPWWQSNGGSNAG